MRRNIIKKRLMSFVFEKAPRVSLSFMLVPVQYREYEYGLLPFSVTKSFSICVIKCVCVCVCVLLLLLLLLINDIFMVKKSFLHML